MDRFYKDAQCQRAAMPQVGGKGPQIFPCWRLKQHLLVRVLDTGIEQGTLLEMPAGTDCQTDGDLKALSPKQGRLFALRLYAITK